MIPAKEFDGELWIKASDFHRQKKKWKGLTAKERSELWWSTDMGGMPEHDYGKKVEALLKEKNG